MAYKRKFKSKFAKKTVKRRKTGLKKSTAAAVKKIAVSAVMKKVETKHKGFIHSKAELTHNSWLPAYCSTMNAIMPSQGLGDNDRIGDRIQALGYKVKLFFGQKGDRPNVNWRVVVFSVPKGTSILASNFFDDVSLNNVMLQDINKDHVTVHHDKIYRPNQAGLTGTGNDEYTFFKKLWIPYRRVVKFGPGDGATAHNMPDLYVGVCVFDAFGTLSTDNIAYYQAWTDIVYKDL